MRIAPTLAIAALAAAPALARAADVIVDFEKSWDYANGAVDGYYAGGTAADGSSGPNLGVSFVGVSGLSNDAAFTYYSGAPSPQGVAYAYDTAYMNVAAGAVDALVVHYSSPAAVTGAVRAYSGLDGSGTLLGSYDLAANGTEGYDSWTLARLTFSGVAKSFEFSAGANIAAYDDIGITISAVPEPATALQMLAGFAGVLVAGARLRPRRPA